MPERNLIIRRLSALGIDWPLDGPPILAAKDAAAKPLAKAECFT